MAKKGIFTGFFERMRKNAEKQRKEKVKQSKTHIVTYNCCWHCGLGFWGYGSVLAMIISYVQGSSLFWTLIHGILSWFYIIYKLFNGVKFF